MKKYIVLSLLVISFGLSPVFVNAQIATPDQTATLIRLLQNLIQLLQQQLLTLQEQSQVTQPRVVIPTPIKENGKCGLTITSPLINSNAIFPLTVTGVVDNRNASQLGCSWQMFEGQAGTAQIYFLGQGNNWHPINTPFIVPVSNWMTSGPTPFSVIVDFYNGGVGLPSGTPMKIVFTEENASGLPPVDIFELPIYLQ